MLKPLLGIILGYSVLCFTAVAAEYAPLPTVKQVDLQRYAGRWFEIALIPNRFQENCICSNALYQLKKGVLRVTNQCYNSKRSEHITAHGKAWPVAGSNNAKLLIQFFWPFKGDYWILDLDKKYRYALVGEPSRRYLWVLSRSPSMSVAQYRTIVNRAQQLGYDITQLVRTDQSCFKGI
ncbi:MAG: lipocalin family protein [Gammaproteobacteria bacterium]